MGFFDAYDYDEINTSYGLTEGKQQPLEITSIKHVKDEDDPDSLGRIVYTITQSDGSSETMLFCFVPDKRRGEEKFKKTMRALKRRLETYKIPEAQAKTFGLDTMESIMVGIKFLGDVQKSPQMVGGQPHPTYKNTYINNVNRRDVATSEQSAGEFNW